MSVYVSILLLIPDFVMKKVVCTETHSAIALRLFYDDKLSIVHSHELTYRIIYIFMCLFAYWQWKLANMSAIIVKCLMAAHKKHLDLHVVIVM